MRAARGGVIGQHSTDAGVYTSAAAGAVLDLHSTHPHLVRNSRHHARDAEEEPTQVKGRVVCIELEAGTAIFE